MENRLTVFSNEIIPVYTNSKGNKVVIGRELHLGLKIDTDYTKWFDRMCEYGFSSPTDFTEYWEGECESIFDIAQFKSPQQAAALGYQRNHSLTLDMAKHIAMIQRTPEGKAIRDQLIALETNVSELSPELRFLIGVELKQKEHDKALAAHTKEIREVNQKVDGIKDVVALSPNSWRPDARKLIVRIAQQMGGNEYIRDMQSEIFKLVDERAGVSLGTRLTFKRRRMADEGICKSVKDRLNKLDVIADDKKLIEIYIAIVKELAIKYGVTVSQGAD